MNLFIDFGMYEPTVPKINIQSVHVKKTTEQ